MLKTLSLQTEGRSRLKATRALFIKHGAESTSEGRSLLLLRKWLSPDQWQTLSKKGYFEVVGGDTGTRYQIHAGTSVNVREIDKTGRRHQALCFMPIGNLPVGDVMLAQKIALETSEYQERRVARTLTPNGFYFGRHGHSDEVVVGAVFPRAPLNRNPTKMQQKRWRLTMFYRS